MEITKFKKSEVSYHIRHDLRELPNEKSYGNKAIDPSLTKNNFAILNRGSYRDVNAYRKSLEKEIFHYNRKNLVYACEAVIQCPSDCPPGLEKDFFQASYDYFVSTLPMKEKCVLLAEVHTDEKHHDLSGNMISKAHLHILYVPAVPDKKHDGYQYKLCADQLTKRAQLKRLHPGLQQYLDDHDIHATVFHKKSCDGKSIALSVSQLKELTQKTGIVLNHSLTIDELSTVINANVLKEKQLQNAKSQLQQKEAELSQLHTQLSKNKLALQQSKTYITELEQQNNSLKQRIKETSIKHEWGTSNSWGPQPEWGNHSHTIERDEEKIW